MPRAGLAVADWAARGATPDRDGGNFHRAAPSPRVRTRVAAHAASAGEAQDIAVWATSTPFAAGRRSENSCIFACPRRTHNWHRVGMHVLTRATPRPVAMSSGCETPSHRVFVYGTLKRGFYNHRLLREMDAKFLGEALTREPMRMVLGEYGIPYLMRGEADGSAVVPGELWEVGDEGLDALDVLEGIDEGMY